MGTVMTGRVMARQAAGQSRLLFRALRTAARLLADAATIGIVVTAAPRKRRKRQIEDETPVKKRKGSKGRKGSPLAATKEEEE